MRKEFNLMQSFIFDTKPDGQKEVVLLRNLVRVGRASFRGGNKYRIGFGVFGDNILTNRQKEELGKELRRVNK
jgi:hypothetical protein